jgi:cytochrome c peroxidase
MQPAQYRKSLAFTVCLLIGPVSPSSPQRSAAERADGTQAALVPLAAAVPAPADNPTLPEKVALGRHLFFDPRLSGDNTMSCATCHLPEKAFGDGLATAKGHEGKILARNTPTVLNVGFHPIFFWDGRAKSLEEQALGCFCDGQGTGWRHGPAGGQWQVSHALAAERGSDRTLYARRLVQVAH